MAIPNIVPRCVIAITLFLTIVSATHAKYSGGTGEPNNPYQIATADDLMLLGETPEDYDKHFILIADIDLDPNLPGGRIFGNAIIAPTQWYSFTGLFDGNGHTISHLTIIGADHVGLFSRLGHPAVIKNLGLVDANITGSGLGTRIGALVAYSHSAEVTRCYSTGVVNCNCTGAWSSCAGGLAQLPQLGGKNLVIRAKTQKVFTTFFSKTFP